MSDAPMIAQRLSHDDITLSGANEVQLNICEQLPLQANDNQFDTCHYEDKENLSPERVESLRLAFH